MRDLVGGGALDLRFGGLPRLLAGGGGFGYHFTVNNCDNT